MMLAGQNGVLHTGAPGHLRQRVRIPLARIKRLRGRVIFVDADALPTRQRAHASHQRPRQLEPPLAAMPPVDEHPEPGFVEPRFHSRALSPVRRRLSTPMRHRSGVQPSAGTSWSYETVICQTKATRPVLTDA